MGFNLLTFPQLEIESTFVSRWNCVHHPIKYTGQRQDAKILNFVNGGTATICVVDAVPADVEVGSIIQYLSSDQQITGETEVLNIIGNNLILGPLGVGFSSGTLLVSSRVGYFLTVRIYGVDEAYAWTLVGEAEFKPDTLGRLEISINAFLKKLVRFADGYDYAAINKRFNDQGSRFTITYREEWQGYTGDFTEFNAKANYFWTNGTKQLREPHNFNAGELVTFPTGPKAKFASDFDRPTMFRGFPFSLTFIYSDNLGGYAVNRVVETFDVNGSNIAGPTPMVLDATQGGGVNRLFVDSNQATSVDFVEVWLEQDGIGTEVIGWDTGTYSDGSYTELYAEELPDNLESL